MARHLSLKSNSMYRVVVGVHIEQMGHPNKAPDNIPIETSQTNITFSSHFQTIGKIFVSLPPSYQGSFFQMNDKTFYIQWVNKIETNWQQICFFWLAHEHRITITNGKDAPMIDYMLFGLFSGLMVFFSLFLISFVTLALITGFMRLASLIVNGVGFDQSATYEQQTA
jgi:hypothetical protein